MAVQMAGGAQREESIDAGAPLARRQAFGRCANDGLE